MFRFSSILRILLILIACSINARSAWARVLTGWLEHSAYRIDIPNEQWNGSLIIYCRGLTLEPPKPSELVLNPALSSLLREGFAVAQAGYSSAGWNVEDGLRDTVALQSYFYSHIAKPKAVYLLGESLGGFIVASLLERATDSYSGGVALCAPLAPATWFINGRLLNLRVLFDFYFPKVLPRPDDAAQLPQGVDIFKTADTLLLANPKAATQLERYAGMLSVKDLAAAIELYTVVLTDIRSRVGTTPFDNRNVIYYGFPDALGVNANISRYIPTLSGLTYFRKNDRLTGALREPLIALYPEYDPIVPASISDHYVQMVDDMGTEDLFVRRLEPGEGHCDLSPSEIVKSFHYLVKWHSTGSKPLPGLR